jgi:hypothetical protein
MFGWWSIMRPRARLRTLIIAWFCAAPFLLYLALTSAAGPYLFFGFAALVGCVASAQRCRKCGRPFTWYVVSRAWLPKRCPRCGEPT